MLAAYGDVDIALDPFPFSSGVTTCELLWMGLPVVTWPQSRPVSRQSLAQLQAIGREEWVARDAEDYIRIAAELAVDVEALTRMRREQRERMRASSLCDATAFANELREVFRRMWKDWCRSGGAPYRSAAP